MCASFICAGFIISLHQRRLPSFRTHDIHIPWIRYWSPRHHCRKSMNVSLAIAFKTLPPHGWLSMHGWVAGPLSCYRKMCSKDILLGCHFVCWTLYPKLQQSHHRNSYFCKVSPIPLQNGDSFFWYMNT